MTLGTGIALFLLLPVISIGIWVFIPDKIVKKIVGEDTKLPDVDFVFGIYIYLVAIGVICLFIDVSSDLYKM